APAIAGPGPGAPSGGSDPAPGASDQKQRLQERDRHRQQAEALRKDGKFSDAIAAAQAALAIDREVFGDTHGEMAGALELLAELHGDGDDWEAAKQARQEVLAIRTKLLGEGHWRVINARWALDRVEMVLKLDGDRRRRILEAERLAMEVQGLRDKEQFGPAQDRARQSLALRRELLGESHPDYARSLDALGVVLYLQGDSASARPLLERAVAIRRDVLGEHHPEYAESLVNLGVLLKGDGDYRRARPLYERALAIHREVHGER